MTRFPPWIRADLRTDRAFTRVHGLLSGLGLHTVCSGARCPNRHECWNSGTATLMVLGGRCTRRCRFCAVESGAPGPVEGDEPERVLAAARAMGLRHVVITSVTRDDLEDGGAGHFARVVRLLKQDMPSATVEVLVPDFQGDPEAVETVLAAGPDVFGHNLETVRRLQPLVRPRASYERSLAVLATAARRGSACVKSGLMVGLGETDGEILEAMDDLAAGGCALLTIGQYLAPTRAHAPVERFVAPDVFERYAEEARRRGFRGVAAAPLVRSSYRAGALLAAARE